MPRPAKETRENWEAGRIPAWRAGEYGHTVRVFSKHGRIKIRYRNPRTGRWTQTTIFPADTPELRRRAATIAVKKAEELRAGIVAEAERTARRVEELTLRDVALLYMRRAPGFPERLLTATYNEVREWYESLPEAVLALKTTPRLPTLVRDVYGWRHLFADPRFRPDRRVLDIDPADATAYAQDAVARGVSKRTAANDLDRLSSAFNYVRTQHRSLGLTYNPIEGRKVDRERAQVPPYSREEGIALWRAAPLLAERGQWQVLVAVGIATSGRRLGSIQRLTLADHDLDAGTVVWRAKNAKGENYGRGDEVRPMTPLHRKAVEWAAQNHPNPLGPEYPIIWRSGGGKKPACPEQPCPQQTLWKQLTKLERLAGVPHLHGRSWHSFRRWAATYLADLLGDGPASEYIGMTVETMRRYSYKQVQHETMARVARAVGTAFEEGS